MKNIYKILFSAVVLFGAVSCNLDYFPVTEYNEGNVEVSDDSGSQYSTREDMEGLRNSTYNSWAKGVQEIGYQDFLIYTECRADNAYGGNPGTPELMAIEANTQDSENKNVVRDWDYYQQAANNAMNSGLMKWFFPLFSLWICASSNAAFALYWVASNLIAMAQNTLINKYVLQQYYLQVLVKQLEFALSLKV